MLFKNVLFHAIVWPERTDILRLLYVLQNVRFTVVCGENEAFFFYYYLVQSDL